MTPAPALSLPAPVSVQHSLGIWALWNVRQKIKELVTAQTGLSGGVHSPCVLLYSMMGWDGVLGRDWHVEEGKVMVVNWGIGSSVWNWRFPVSGWGPQHITHSVCITYRLFLCVCKNCKICQFVVSLFLIAPFTLAFSGGWMLLEAIWEQSCLIAAHWGFLFLNLLACAWLFAFCCFLDFFLTWDYFEVYILQNFSFNFQSYCSQKIHNNLFKC